MTKSLRQGGVGGRGEGASLADSPFFSPSRPRQRGVDVCTAAMGMEEQRAERSTMPTPLHSTHTHNQRTRQSLSTQNISSICQGQQRWSISNPCDPTAVSRLEVRQHQDNGVMARRGPLN